MRPDVNSPKHVYKLQDSLLLASRRGDTETVRALLDDGVSPSCSNDRGDSCLHMACAGGCQDIVRLLLDACANVTASDVLGRTCLHVVCEVGSVELLQMILDRKDHRVNINALATGSITPLHLCSMLGHHQVARLLLLSGASLELKDGQGMTAIHHAASKGHLDMVNLLGEHDEEMMLLSQRDQSGQTALHHAVEKGHVEIVKTLLGFSHNPNVRTYAGQNCLDLAFSILEPKKGHRYGTPPFTRDENGVQEEIVTLLKEYGAKQNGRSEERSITFMETELSSPSPTREERMKEKRSRVPSSKKIKKKYTMPLMEQQFEKKVEKQEIVEMKTLPVISEESNDANAMLPVEKEWVTYLDAESQCYYESHIVTGDAKWLTWEESQAIGVQRNWR